MRIAIVAGPDAGHALPAIALARKHNAAGDTAVVYTGMRWAPSAARIGVTVRQLPCLDDDAADDTDAGARLGRRAVRMAVALVPLLRSYGPDLVISDVLTVAGGYAAELLGAPWTKLSPHPLYERSRGLPPIGAGLAPGTGLRGHARDHLFRFLSGRSERVGERQRARARRTIGLPPQPVAPRHHLIATIPALEVPRPDWPARTHLIGALHHEPTTAEFALPPGGGPLVLVAPSTAHTGIADLVQVALAAATQLRPQLPVRLVISGLDVAQRELPEWAVAGLGRQDLVLRQAAAAICGSGHGILAKTILAGVPTVLVPGGGDQWELATRAARQGFSEIVRPVTVEAMSAALRAVLSEGRYRDAVRAAAHGPVVDPLALTGQSD